ncbi:MAG: phytoene desaturase family protein [Lentisphaeria bacterium]
MSTNGKRILIVGAGPGGLTAAMILANRGFEVEVFEKEDRVGGRNANLQLDKFNFDLGPTFLMLKNLLDEAFKLAGAKSDDLLDFRQLEPMYRLQFDDRKMEPSSDREEMKRQIAQAFPGKEDRLDAFLERESKRFKNLIPCLKRPYSSLRSLCAPPLLKAVPHLALGKSLYDLLYEYFEDPKLTISFTFQSKYLGMSPWECPGVFAMLSYIEHGYGIYHVQGGVCQISQKMAEVAEANGAKIHLNTAVKQLQLDGRKATGLILENGDTVDGDEVVINADFGYAMTNLIPEGVLKKYTPPKLAKKHFSCSTFMLYLGLDKLYDMPHHTIIFAEDYKRNVDEVFKFKILSEDISFYVRNASVTDPSLAPEGKSAVYVLVPVPNLRGEIDWDKEQEPFREKVLDAIEKNTSMTDIRQHIEAERIITPVQWEDSYSVHIGATFNLAHNIKQMIYLRPHNKFEELDHCYLVGGGTHPGSGLPTIYESGRIAADMIAKAYN